MAKKFFYNRVYNTRRNIINIIIIGVCVIGIIVCFIVTSNFQKKEENKPEKVLNIKSEVTVEVNETYSKEIFFSKIENVNLDQIEISYDENFDISKIGKYNVLIKVNDKDYNSTLIVVDTTKPELMTKNVTINEQDSYSAQDFVSECKDNSNDQCIISFYEGVDEEGNKPDYSKYTSNGIYSVKIIAKDTSGNFTIKEEKLFIKKKGNTKPIEEQTTPQTCKYGNDSYDKDNYIIAIEVATNHCAVSLDLYKDSSMTEEINKLMNSESIKIQKDVDALNLSGTFALNRKITAVVNTTGDGIVGYELQITVTVSQNNSSKIIAEYKIDTDGKRIFSINPYNLK